MSVLYHCLWYCLLTFGVCLLRSSTVLLEIIPLLCWSSDNEKMQVLWHSSCLDSLLFSVYDNTSSTVVNDPAWTAAVRSLYQKVVREWIIISLSYAPCTSQGLLQVCFCLPIHIIFYFHIQISLLWQISFTPIQSVTLTFLNRDVLWRYNSCFCSVAVPCFPTIYCV